MTLHTTITGSGPRLVLLHGFTQNADCWGPIVDDLDRDFTVVRVDAPGHGDSFHDSADLWEAGRLVGEAGGKAHYVGYSMGGRMALHLTAQMPELVKSLTLIGVTAGLDTDDERSTRRRADAALAAKIDEIGLEAFLEWWLELPLFDGVTAEQACFTERLENRSAGLQASLLACGTGRQEPLWPLLHRLRVPVHVIVGERDTKFAAIGNRMVELFGPSASMTTIPNAGHAAHLQMPSAFTAALRAFIGGLGADDVASQ